MGGRVPTTKFAFKNLELVVCDYASRLADSDDLSQRDYWLAQSGRATDVSEKSRFA